MAKTVRFPFRNQGVLSSGLIITIGKTSPVKDLNKLESHKPLWKSKVVSRRNQREILYILQHVFSYCFYFLCYVYLIVEMELQCNHARIIYGSKCSCSFSTDTKFIRIFLIILETFYMVNVLFKQGRWILKACYCPNMQTCYCPNMLLYQLVNFLEPDTGSSQ